MFTRHRGAILEYTINSGIAPTLLYEVPTREGAPILHLVIKSLRDYYPYVLTCLQLRRRADGRHLLQTLGAPVPNLRLYLALVSLDPAPPAPPACAPAAANRTTARHPLPDGAREPHVIPRRPCGRAWRDMARGASRVRRGLVRRRSVRQCVSQARDRGGARPRGA